MKATERDTLATIIFEEIVNDSRIAVDEQTVAICREAAVAIIAAGFRLPAECRPSG